MVKEIGQITESQGAGLTFIVPSTHWYNGTLLHVVLGNKYLIARQDVTYHIKQPGEYFVMIFRTQYCVQPFQHQPIDFFEAA